jgi:hypothetical protein
MIESLENRTLFSSFSYWQPTTQTAMIPKYTGPTLNAQGNDVPIQSIQLTPERLTLSPDPNP